MSVRLSYVVSSMRNEMKSLSVCHTWFPIWGMKWNSVCPSQSYVVSNKRNEMLNVVCPSVIRGFQYEEWNVCPSVIRGFQFEEWNEILSVCLSHTWFPIWRMKWNEMSVRLSYVVSNMRNEMSVRLSYVVSNMREWNEMLSVRLSYVVSNIRNEMKCCLSVCHMWFPIWGMKWKVVYPSVVRGFQYEEWNQMSVRLSQK